MKMQKFLSVGLIISSVILTSSVQGNIYPIELFTNNGMYNDSPDVNLFVVVTDISLDQVDFKVYNKNLFDSSIAAIYFDGGALSSLDEIRITNTAGTNFSLDPSPGNLPSGKTLVPVFEATEGFTAGPENKKPQYGINPGEHLIITFNLISSFGDLIDDIESGDLRIGVHLIALPDGSSESGVTPEPATVTLLGFGALSLFYKKHAYSNT